MFTSDAKGPRMRFHLKTTVILALFLGSLLFWVQAVKAVTPQQLKKLRGQKKTEATAEVQKPEQLTGDQIDSMVATLSDEEARRLLIEELKKKAEENTPVNTEAQASTERGIWLKQLFDEADSTAAGIFKRIRGIFRGSASVLSQPRALIAILSNDRGTVALLMTFVWLFVLIGTGLLAEKLLLTLSSNIHQQLITAVPRGTLNKLGNVFCHLLLDGFGIVAYIVVSFIFLIVFFDKGNAAYIIIATYLITSYYFRIIIFLANFVLSPARPTLRLIPMADEDATFLYRWFLRITLVAALIAGASIIVQNMRISEDLSLLLYSAAGLSVFLLFIIMIWQSRDRVAQAICGDTDDGTCDYSPLRAGFAKTWHIFAMLYVIVVGCFWQISALIEGKGKIVKLIASLFVVPIFIGIDQWGQRLLKAASGELHETIDLSGDDEPEKGDESDAATEPTSDSAPKLAEEPTVRHYAPYIKRLFRAVLVISLFFLVLRLWGIDVSVTRVFSSTVLSILAALLVGLIVWEYSRTLIDRKLGEEFPDADEEMEEGGPGGTRRGTLLLLLRKFILAVLVVMVTMMVLSELGVDIGPMIAGAGILGLAIGFGAQTLVKDIISGVFFLVDDAFRVGDYVETGGVRGSVEHISLRSLRLRHHRGAIHTIPFGNMKSVANYSRDYQIMKLEFRVRYDTDIDKVRKIIKKINNEIMKNEELAAGLLDKVKSQGVKALDDSAMIMRVKFKTIPGQQFVIRREVFRLMQEAFHEQGIEFAHRNVTVYLPQETTSADKEKEDGEKDTPPSGAQDQKVLEQAAAAAALAVIQEEEEKKQQEAAKKKK